MDKKDKYRVAVVGATGAVGKEMISVLEERGFPISELIPMASYRTAGTQVSFGNRSITVKELKRLNREHPEYWQADLDERPEP